MSSALTRFLAARSNTAPVSSQDAGLRRCRELSRLLDDALVEATGRRFRGAVVAVGGSGRREQCTLSDIDLMLLVPAEDDDMAAEALYPLWDAQLQVGYSVRTPGHAIEAAEARLETFTSLLDARFVCGDPELFAQFLAARRELVRSKRSWLRSELAAYHERQREREPWQLMAVDLKASRGGLRALQAVHWLEAAREIATGRAGTLWGDDREAVRDRLLATRNALHALGNRPTEVFRPELMTAVGEWLNEDAFDWARNLYGAMRWVDASAGQQLGDVPKEENAQNRGDLESLTAVLQSAADAGPLEPMPSAPWLGRLLPEWEVLRSRPHLAPFHVNPVDVHVMRAVAEARTVMTGDDCAMGLPGIAEAYGDPTEILLATFLHDVGKGHHGDHSQAGAVVADRFAARAALTSQLRQRIVTAVREHLLLPAVATRRDIADDRVVQETARRIGSTQTLRLLYILVVADGRASGPNVWNAWKAQLVHTLYQRLLAFLEADDANDGAEPDRVVRALAGQVSESEVRAHLQSMDTTYLVSTPAATIADHLALIEEAGDGTATRLDRFDGFDRLTIATRDRPALLQAIAGTLAGHNASVLSGVAYTRSDGVVVQVWHVRDALEHGIDDRRWERLLAAVPQSVAGIFPVDQRLAEVNATYPEPVPPSVPTHVNLDNRASSDYTVIEVSTADRRGVLYRIARALYREDIDIHLAKVDTIGPEVMDTFYVRHSQGSRIETPEEIERIRARLTRVVTGLDA